MENKTNKKASAVWLMWTLGGLLLLSLVALVAYFTMPITGFAVASSDKISIIVPLDDVAPGTPQVVFIGVTTKPLDLDKNQGIINNIVITFSEAMNPTTVNKDTILVKGPNNAIIQGAITSDSTKKIWTFNPTDNLKFNSVYTITITTGAKGVSGNSLVKNFVWSFTTSYSSGGGSSGGSGSSNPTPTPTPIILVLTTIKLTPTSTSLTIGSNKSLNATGLDQNGAFIVSIINFTTSNSSVAIVNASGFVTAIALGNATITATSGAIINTSKIYVISLGGCPAVSVNLGTAGDFAILTKSGISTTGTTAITGDLGVSPIDSTAITGFGLIMDASNTYSTSSLVTGKIYAPDYTGPPSTTESKMTTAIGDMETAYTTAMGLAACVTELGAGDIGGMTLTSGVYKWATDLNIPTDVTLSGSATDVWVFQIDGKLDIASGKQVILSGGALAKNIYWIVADTTTLGTTSVFNGNILDKTNIDLLTGATLNGRALAQTAVTLDANPITKSI